MIDLITLELPIIECEPIAQTQSSQPRHREVSIIMFCIRKQNLLVVIAAIVSCLPTAQAAVISFSDSVPLSTTNWTHTISVPKFDPSLGTLDSVSFHLAGHVEGSARFESLDATKTNVTMRLAADIRLRRPDKTDLVISLPVANTSDLVSPYDGTIDFSGPSGRSYTGLSASDSDTAELLAPLNPIDEDNFVGAGEVVSLIVRATGASRGMGAGNLVLLFATSASADVHVSYAYTPVPEPQTAILCGLPAILVFYRRWIRSYRTK